MPTPRSSSRLYHRSSHEAGRTRTANRPSADTELAVARAELNHLAQRNAALVLRCRALFNELRESKASPAPIAKLVSAATPQSSSDTETLLSADADSFYGDVSSLAQRDVGAHTRRPPSGSTAEPAGRSLGSSGLVSSPQGSASHESPQRPPQDEQHRTVVEPRLTESALSSAAARTLARGLERLTLHLTLFAAEILPSRSMDFMPPLQQQQQQSHDERKNAGKGTTSHSDTRSSMSWIEQDVLAAFSAHARVIEQIETVVRAKLNAFELTCGEQERSLHDYAAAASNADAREESLAARLRQHSQDAARCRTAVDESTAMLLSSREELAALQQRVKEQDAELVSLRVKMGDISTELAKERNQRLVAEAALAKLQLLWMENDVCGHLHDVVAPSEPASSSTLSPLYCTPIDAKQNIDRDLRTQLLETVLRSDMRWHNDEEDDSTPQPAPPPAASPYHVRSAVKPLEPCVDVRVASMARDIYERAVNALR